MNSPAQNGAKWPSGLKTAAQLSESLKVDATALRDLAISGFAPHWRVGEGEPLFQTSEVRQWLAENMLKRFDGKALPTILYTVVDAAEERGRRDIPKAIRNFPGLCPLNPYPPGIYFLCDGAEIVYVGQSVNPASRIIQHSGKEFTSAFLLPWPAFDLDRVEGALIRHLRPKLNRFTGNGTGAPKVDDADVGHIVKEIMGASNG